MDTLHVTGRTKTYEAWAGQLTDHLNLGDCVDEALYWYFLEVLPPAHWSDRIVQIGEPQDHAGPEGRARFSTLQRYGEAWYYTGYRVAGEEVALLQAIAQA